MKEILRELDNKLTETDLDGIIEEVDEDGSGTLDFDGEFTGYNNKFIEILVTYKLQHKNEGIIEQNYVRHRSAYLN